VREIENKEYASRRVPTERGKPIYLHRPISLYLPYV
jgi:hypothetical protein